MPSIQYSEKTSEGLCTFAPIGQTPAPGYSKKNSTKPCSVCALGGFPCILHINPNIENGRRARCEICEETGDDCDAEFPEVPVRRIFRLKLRRASGASGESGESEPGSYQADYKSDEDVEKGAGAMDKEASDVEKRKAWWRMKQMILEALENSCMDGGL